MKKKLVHYLTVTLISIMVFSCANKKNNSTIDPKAEEKAMVEELIQKIHSCPKKKNQIVLLPLDSKESAFAMDIEQRVAIIQLLILQDRELTYAFHKGHPDIKRIGASFVLNEYTYEKTFGETWTNTMEKPHR